MGAINNAFNQALGAAAGAGLAIKHAEQTDESKMNTAEHAALIARNQAMDAEAEYNKAEAENFWTVDEKGQFKSVMLRSAEADKAVDKAKAAFEEAPDIETRKKKFNDLAAAINAREALNAKIEAIDNMRTRAKEQRAYADKASQIAEREQKIYKSKWEWGGK